MNTDDIRIPLREMRDAFMRCVGDYAVLRHYLYRVHGDRDPDLLAWQKANHVLMAETPESDAWEHQFWGGWHSLMDVILAYDAESDEINTAVYEEGLITGAPWAEEAHEARFEE